MRILVLADIHIGAIKDIIYVYRVLIDILTREMMKQKIDMVVFLGDYFDRLFKVNEDYVNLAISVMQHLMSMCKRTGCKMVRFVYGTESHEMGQYNLFTPFFEDKEVDVKLFETASIEEVKGEKILYLPEEYIDDKHEYYKNILYDAPDGYYDYIFGHGVIAEGMTMVREDKSERRSEKKTPIFKSDELTTKGKLVLFGHYHINNEFYLGSLFRYKFGEDRTKYYGVIDDGKLELIENEQVYLYRSYSFDSKSPIYTDAKEFKKAFTAIFKEENNQEIADGEYGGKIRFIFDLPEDIDIVSTFKETIRNTFGGNKHISLTLNTKLDIEDKEEQTEDEDDYILDKGLPIEDKLLRFIDDRHQKRNAISGLTIPDIREVLYEDLAM
jgi:predicted phosphodiesterase